MTRFTLALNGWQGARGKKKEGRALHLCDREGSGRVTSFLTSSLVTPPLPASSLGGARRLSEALVKRGGASEWEEMWRRMLEDVGE